MTHGPGTLAGRVPVTVSVFPLGSVTLKVLAFTWRTTGVVVGQRLLAQAWRWHHVITPRGQRAEREGERSE
jgi:hypothetical protein